MVPVDNDSEGFMRYMHYTALRILKLQYHSFCV